MDIAWNPVPKPNHNRKAKKRGERSKFSKFVRDQVKEKYNNQCAICSGRAFHVHHVQPRSRGGRNVFTNATLLCAACHRKVHEDNALLKYFIEKHKKLYGPLFFMDLEDLKVKYLTQDLREEDREVREWKKYNGKLELSTMVRMATESDQRRDESR